MLPAVEELMQRLQEAGVAHERPIKLRA